MGQEEYNLRYSSDYSVAMIDIVRYDAIHIPTTLPYIKNFRTTYLAEHFIEKLGPDRVYMQSLGSQYLRTVPDYFNSYIYGDTIPNIVEVFGHEFFIKENRWVVSISRYELEQYKGISIYEIQNSYDRN